MKNFQNLREFEKFLSKVISTEKIYKTAILEVVTQFIEDKAKKKIGHLQEAAGPFKAWAPLAESTKTEKARLGYFFNDEYNPLFRTGHLRDSISHFVQHTANNYIGVVGSDDEIMVYQELGTIHIPSRSVLGAAAFESKIPLQKIFSEGFTGWLLQKSPIKKGGTYD